MSSDHVPDDDLGPLPKADANSALQRQSLAALQHVIAHEHLVIRDERVDDYGVDASLEVVVSGEATNFRAQVQLKGRTNLKPNADGSVSVAVPTSNLNYLLNGPCPLYVLYLKEEGELRYAFARDEERRIAGALPSWKNQDNVTLRFANVLDGAALKLIRECLLAEAKLHRKLRDTLSALSPRVATQLRVDTAVPLVQSPEDAAATLIANGMSLVASGHAAKVLDLAALLRSDQLRAEPKLLLVRGYAEFFNRNYLSVEAPLRQALLAQERLTEDERGFLAFLLNAVELSTGRIDDTTFRSRAGTWRASAPTHLAIQYDILNLWMAQFDAASPGEFRDRVANLRKALNAAKADPRVPSSARQSARVLELFVTAHDCAEELGQALLVSNEPDIWRRRYPGGSPSSVTGAIYFRIDGWRAAFASLLAAIERSGDVQLLCEACLSRDLAETFFMTQMRNAAAVLGTPSPIVPEALLRQVQATRELARRTDQVELELRALLTESAFEDMLGNALRADELTTEVRVKADILRYADIERAAARQLSGETRSSRTIAEISALKNGGIEAALAVQSDSELEEQARESLRMLRLPEDRFPVLVEVARSLRATCAEQVRWCRHLRLLEVGSGDPNDLYREVPYQTCRCERFDHRSSEPSSAWRRLIDEFKQTSCASCPARDPLQA
jgi:hypothetical protein